ncbi:hypothetical protein WICPIJ_000026 [Wickerhamomyces pijperi]|uniref:Nitronate monooxygenase domain-containing protein n=1 Tax=Wickerhamomyces pijperi TaxID=599730 RepID=A0A9P8QDE1_WICPI|nr:hypothetical protein WICPIJ_000026 [Wickerhamomyces pijperi]
MFRTVLGHLKSARPKSLKVQQQQQLSPLSTSSNMKKTQTQKFLDTFNLKYPIIQSPMAGASTVKLASSVTKLGGLGSIPLGAFSYSGSDVDKIRSQYQQYQSLLESQPTVSANTVNLNFFAHDPPHRDLQVEQRWISKVKELYGFDNLNSVQELKLIYPTFKSITDHNDPILELLKQIDPQMISFHFGLPQLSIIKQLQSFGTKIFVSVTNLEEFKQALKCQVDGVILQGYEAGGHRGNFKQNDPQDEKLPVRQLTEQVTEYIKSESEASPFIIAAGGFHDSKQIKDFIQEFDIAGVQLGTVWLPSTDCTISQRHLEHFIDPQTGVSTIMNPAISGRCLRTIESDFLNQLMSFDDAEIPDYPLPYDLFKKLRPAHLQALEHVEPDSLDSFKFSAFLAGSNYHLSYKGTRDTQEIFRQLTKHL